MLKWIAARHSPESRRRRKAEGWLAWQEAGAKADERRDRGRPRPEGFYRGYKQKKPK